MLCAAKSRRARNGKAKKKAESTERRTEVLEYTRKILPNEKLIEVAGVTFHHQYGIFDTIKKMLFVLFALAALALPAPLLVQASYDNKRVGIVAVSSQKLFFIDLSEMKLTGIGGGMIKSSCRYTIESLVVILAALTISSGASAKPQYSITDLGAPLEIFGSQMVWPSAMNDNGLIAGSAMVPAEPSSDPEELAFLLDSSSGQLNLGLFGDPHGAAGDINASGQVVGRAWLPPAGRKAVLWQADQGTTILPDFGAGVWVYGLNDLGQVVGWAETQSSESFAVFWDENHVLKELQNLNGQHSEAYDINNAGLIVGRAMG